MKSWFNQSTSPAGAAQPITAEGFRAWAAAREIILDDRYPSSQPLLVFKPYRNLERFWERPQDPDGLAHFLQTLLQSTDDWQSCFLWSRNGSWAPTTEGEGDALIATVYRGAGIPEGWKGAVQFERKDLASVLAVLFVHCAFGWSTCEDIFFVPDHGRLILGVDHHDVVWAHFAREEGIAPFVCRMAGAGYELPKELPDATFKPQPWIKEKE